MNAKIRSTSLAIPARAVSVLALGAALGLSQVAPLAAQVTTSQSVIPARYPSHPARTFAIGGRAGRLASAPARGGGPTDPIQGDERWSN